MNAEYSDRDGYLLVKALTPWTETTAKRLIDETIGEATSRGYQRVLFDLRQWSQPDSETVRFRSGEHLAKTFPGSVKIAAIARPEAITRYGEETAINRGAFFRIFPDEAQAIQWLMSDAETRGADQPARV